MEDDPDWIKAITAYVNEEPDLLVAGAAASAAQAVSLARTVPFDVVLLDIQLGDGADGPDGIDAALAIGELRPARMIMLTAMDDPRLMTEAFAAGAVNYLDKTRFAELPQAIRTACRHSGPMDALLLELSRLRREERLSVLTPAEREVYERIEEGRSQSEMERELYKSERTIKNQVGKILKKLGVRSRREAVEFVRRGRSR
ncbi:response regulator transcription factor [Paenibacillus sabuli]|uniref:response regulator transcription factor n=1 Tax=Paenibacillus sabuli TaxID=2772509 RepID=UPI00295AED3D|nr:response regulator transcription factor [Paenibacillus sabuli]